MKKCVFALALCLALVCCKKTDPEDKSTPEKEKQTFEVSFTGKLNEYVSDDSGSAREYWADGDKVLLIDRGTKKYLGILDAVVDATDNSKAEFSGKIAEPEGTEIIMAVSPGLNENTISIGSQIYSLACEVDCDGGRNSFIAYAVQSKDALNTGSTVSFDYATALVRINFDGVPTWQRIESVSMLSVPTVSQLGIEELLSSSCKTGDLTLHQNFIMDDSGKFSVEVAVPVCEKSDVMFVLNGTLFRQSKKISGMQFDAGRLYQKSIAFDGSYEELGKLDGVFSVSPSVKVKFSKGNLRATTSDGWKHTCWDFYDHQYDINSITEAARKESIWDWAPQLTDTEMDLFTWGYGEWSSNPSGTDYYKSETSLGGDTDWGSHVFGGTWRTLSHSEWNFLFNNVECM